MTAPIPNETAPKATESLTPPTPIQRAAQEARQRLAQGELNLPGSLAPASTPSVPGAQPVAEAAPVETPPAVEPVDTEPTEDVVAGETAEAAEETETAEATEETTEGEEPKRFTISIPNNREGLPDIELEVDDEHTYQVLGMLKNSFKRTEELKAERAIVEQKADELDDFRGQLEVDPIGFIEDYVPEDARLLVVASMISDPKLFPQVLEMVKSFSQSRDRLESARMRIENERLKTREQLKTQQQVRRETRKNVGEIMSAIKRMVPGTLTGEKAQAFIDEARQEVSEYATRHALTTLPVTDLPLILTQRLLAYGIDPVQTAARLAGKQDETTSSPKTGQSTVGARIKQASDRRKAAAVSAPAGVSQTAAEPKRPPKGMNIKEAADWAKKNLI